MSHAEDPHAPRLHGLLAEFDSPDALVSAGRRAVQEGYRELDAYTPFPIEALHEALGFHRTRVPLLVLVGGQRRGDRGIRAAGTGPPRLRTR